MITQILINGIVAGSIYGLIAMSFAWVYRATKYFNLAHGSTAVLGGYLAFGMSKCFHMNELVAVPLSIVLTGLFGVLISALVFLPLKQNGSSNTVLLVSSMGVMTIIQAGLATVFTNQFVYLGEGYFESVKIYLAGLQLTSSQVYAVICGLVVLFILLVIKRYTKYGQLYTAVCDSEMMSSVVGINAKNVILISVFIGSCIAGVCGVLVGYDIGLVPSFGMGVLIMGVSAAVIGGNSSVYMPLLAAYGLGIAENCITWQFGGEWKYPLAFTLAIIFMAYREIVNK